MDSSPVLHSYDRLDDAIGLLRVLADIYSVNAADVAELSLGSDGRAAATVYPCAGGTLEQVHRTLDADGIAPQSRCVLETLWRAIPSRRCATRLLLDGGVSLFWPIDLDATAVRRLLAALISTPASERGERFFRAAGGRACGIAYERTHAAEQRCRSYLMAPHRAALEQTLDAAVAHLGIDVVDARWLGDWIPEADETPFDVPVAVNVAFDAAGQASIKLELPGIPVMPVPPSAGCAQAEFWREAAQAAARTGCRHFNYLGARSDENGRRTLTAYIDGHTWLCDTREEPSA